MPQIVPDAHANRLAFLKNLKALIISNATTLTLTPAQVTAMNAVLDPLIAAYQALVDAEQAVIVANANAAQVFSANSDALSALFAQLKANPNLTDGLRAEMQIQTTPSQHDPANIKPKIKAASQSGSVHITGSKDYAELINLYMRRVGEMAWTLIGIRRKKLPFDDQTPLKVANVPEQREYMARGVNGDDEVGQPSDIVQVTFAG